LLVCQGARVARGGDPLTGAHGGRLDGGLVAYADDDGAGPRRPPRAHTAPLPAAGLAEPRAADASAAATAAGEGSPAAAAVAASAVSLPRVHGAAYEPVDLSLLPPRPPGPVNDKVAAKVRAMAQHKVGRGLLGLRCFPYFISFIFSNTTTTGWCSSSGGEPQAQGMDINRYIMDTKLFNNPCLYENLVGLMEIDQTGAGGMGCCCSEHDPHPMRPLRAGAASNYPADTFNPKMWRPSDMIDALGAGGVFFFYIARVGFLQAWCA
jgi:hypothetical protein